MQKTIAEIYGLTTQDSWREVAVFDELGQTYVNSFVDPPDNESVMIPSNTRTIFHRVKVENQRLSHIVAIDNSIPIVAICMSNNRTGCWIAFTSIRVAKRVSAKLIAAGMIAEWDTCDQQGEPIK